MAALGLKPRRRGGKILRRRPPPSRRSARKPRLKKLRVLFVLLGLGVLGAGLDGLRDDGRGLPGPAGDLQLRPVQGLQEQRGRRRHRRTDRHADQRPEQDPAHLGRRSPPTSRTRWSRSRTPASTNTAGSTSRGIGRALVKDILSQSAAPGRLDDHRAVRQERARSRRQPHGPGEVPRGGARLPARAPLEQGQNPHRVPEHDLLRRGRLRDRGRRPHLLRRRPPRLRDRRPSPAPRCSSPGRPRLLAGIIPSPSAYDPKVFPENALGRRNLVLEKMYEQGYITQEQHDRRAAAGAARHRPTSSRRRFESKAPYFTA